MVVAGIAISSVGVYVAYDVAVVAGGVGVIGFDVDGGGMDVLSVGVCVDSINGVDVGCGNGVGIV